MSSAATLIYSEYETIVAELTSQHHNIDPYLLIKSAMLRKKYPLENKQHFWLGLYYKNGINPDSKSKKIFENVGRLPSYHGHNHFVLDLQASLDTVLLLASDPDINEISGEVFPISA